MSLKVAVYLSSSRNVSPTFHEATEQLAEELVARNCEIIYGGANIGLMGTLADVALAKGGKVHGVIPEHDFMDGLVHEGLTSQKKVKTLWERKAQMEKMAQAFVVAPGGLGTLDEATDIMVLKQTGESKKPLVFFNYLDFWKPFLESLEILGAQGMIYGEMDDLFQVQDSARKVVEAVCRPS